jgi:hypothetical protein
MSRPPLSLSFRFNTFSIKGEWAVFVAALFFRSPFLLGRFLELLVREVYVFGTRFSGKKGVDKRFLAVSLLLVVSVI